MKKIKLDLFKVILLVLLTWITYSFYNFSNKDRYKSIGMFGTRIIDTHTGSVYYSEGEKFIEGYKIPEWWESKTSDKKK